MPCQLKKKNSTCINASKLLCSYFLSPIYLNALIRKSSDWYLVYLTKPAQLYIPLDRLVMLLVSRQSSVFRQAECIFHFVICANSSLRVVLRIGRVWDDTGFSRCDTNAQNQRCYAGRVTLMRTSVTGKTLSHLDAKLVFLCQRLARVGRGTFFFLPEKGRCCCVIEKDNPSLKMSGLTGTINWFSRIS